MNRIVNLRSLVNRIPSVRNPNSTPSVRNLSSTPSVKNLSSTPSTRNLSSGVAALREPNEPKVVTQQIPGPQGLNLKEQLGHIQQSSGVMLFVDYEKSVGKLF